MKNKLTVLSLFDGISCGMLALERAKISVEKYYASEIDKYATAISQKNFPNIIRLGDINNWKTWSIDWENIDLLIGGSPCQGFSFAGKQLNFKDTRSKLFFVYVDILRHIKTKNPNIKFLLENVRMKKEFQEIISDYLGVRPVLIDSNLVSAQNRKRLYWANWKFEQPRDKNIFLKDIIHENSITERQHVYDIISEYIVPIDKTLKILDKEVKKGKVGYFRKDSQANRVYYINDKAVTLCGDAGGGAAKMGQYLFGCITPDRINKRQNGRRFNSGKKIYTLTAQDKHGIFVNGYIRKLTPVECERLQTLPDNFTKCNGVSNSQRYKTLGNGWTVDVIAHILMNLK